MVSITVTYRGFNAHFDICEMDVNSWIEWAQRHNMGISVEAESEAYQRYLREFPLNDPRD